MQKNQNIKPMERLFVAWAFALCQRHAYGTKACSSVGIAQPLRNFLAQSSSIGGVSHKHFGIGNNP